MFRLPKSRIVLFVLLSMTTAFAYHYWYLPKVMGQKTFASLSTKDISEQANELLEVVGETPKKSVDSCQCTVAGVEEPFLSPEEADKCGPERTFLEPGLAQLDPLFTAERAKSSADFPKECITYILRSTNRDAETKDATNFASCESSKAKPQRGFRKPCVTKAYVNAVYNSFGDLTDCFGAPARDYLPKLAMESGFHLNIIGGIGKMEKDANGVERMVYSSDDSGIPQFIKISIESANSEFEATKRFVANSENESCKRLAPYTDKLEPISSGFSQRCGLMTTPNNPMLSLFYMMIKYRADVRALEKYLNKPENDIFGKMKKLGLDSSKFDREKLNQILMVLAYNSGAAGTVKVLKEYLESIASMKKPRTLELSDFDIGSESFIYRKINNETQLLRRQPNNTDAVWQTRKADFEALVTELGKTNLRFKPKAVPTTISDPVFGDYESYKLEFEKGDLTFAAYTMLYQGSGNGGYLSKVKNSANALNTKFKEGVCVPDSYLAL